MFLHSPTIILDENWYIIGVCIQHQDWFLVWFTIKRIAGTTKWTLVLDKCYFWISTKIYLTWAPFILCFEKIHTRVFASLITLAVYDTLSQANTLFLLTGIQILFILWGRIFATYTDWIWTIGTTVWAIDVTRTILILILIEFKDL